MPDLWIPILRGSVVNRTTAWLPASWNRVQAEIARPLMSVPPLSGLGRINQGEAEAGRDFFFSGSGGGGMRVECQEGGAVFTPAGAPESVARLKRMSWVGASRGGVSVQGMVQ